MAESAMPVAVVGETRPIVEQVRRVLNVPGGELFDHQLADIIRGVQFAAGLPPNGWIDEDLLALLGVK